MATLDPGLVITAPIVLIVDPKVLISNVPSKYQTTLTTGGGLVGAEVRIYELDSASPNNLGTEIAGIESSTATFSFSSYGGNEVWLQVMKAGFAEYGERFTIPDYPNTLQVILTPEQNS